MVATSRDSPQGKGARLTLHASKRSCGSHRYLTGADLTEADVRLFTTPIRFDTVDFDHIKTHYYAPHRNINPTGIVPAGPAIDYAGTHGGAWPGAPSRDRGGTVAVPPDPGSRAPRASVRWAGEAGHSLPSAGSPGPPPGPGC